MTGRVTTGAAAGGSEGPRPLTSVKGAGFMSKPPGTGLLGKSLTSTGGSTLGSTGGFDGSRSGPAPALAQKTDNSPDEGEWPASSHRRT